MWNIRNKLNHSQRHAVGKFNNPISDRRMALASNCWNGVRAERDAQMEFVLMESLLCLIVDGNRPKRQHIIYHKPLSIQDALLPILLFAFGVQCVHWHANWRTGRLHGNIKVPSVEIRTQKQRKRFRSGTFGCVFVSALSRYSDSDIENMFLHNLQ